MATAKRTPAPRRKGIIRLSPSGPELDASLIGAIESFESVSANQDASLSPGDPIPIPRVGGPGFMEVRFPLVRPGRRLVLLGVASFVAVTAQQVRIQLAASFDAAKTFVPITEYNNGAAGLTGGEGGRPQIWPLLATIDVPTPVGTEMATEVVGRILVGGNGTTAFLPSSQSQATWLVGLVVRRSAAESIAITAR